MNGMQQVDGEDDDEKLVWACTCKQGGVITRQGTDSADAVLGRTAAEHLRARGNERHRIDVGRYFTSAKLGRPAPVEWGEDQPSGRGASSNVASCT
jgi:hypothetical protein